MMPMLKKIVAPAAGISILLWLLVCSVSNQFQLNVLPFKQNFAAIRTLLGQDDLAQLKALAPDFYQLAAQIKTYPENTAFFFAPCFEDSGNSGVWWWYLCLLTRYMTYPDQPIFFMDWVLYQDRKDIFLQKFVGQAKTYQDLDWLKSHDIQYVILMRNNNVVILPITQEIHL